MACCHASIINTGHRFIGDEPMIFIIKREQLNILNDLKLASWDTMEDLSLEKENMSGSSVDLDALVAVVCIFARLS